MSYAKQIAIISFGEVVWDIFPNGEKILGGAPLNISFHLTGLGLPTIFISRVGSDKLGIKTRDIISEAGLSSAGIQVDDTLPTGTVTVSFSEKDEPSYIINKPSAWDEIDHDLARSTAENIDEFILVFGTLSQREQISRNSLRSLWRKASAIYYDVNLRPPYTPDSIVRESMTVADVVKMNDIELRHISGWLNKNFKDDEERAWAIQDEYSTDIIVVTRGAKGAFLVCKEGYFHHPGFPAQVKDTVGSGDAFFAALIYELCKHSPMDKCLERANKLGAFVAECSGATPAIPAQLFD